MKNLYAPWRSNYIRLTETQKTCPLCLEESAELDEKNYVIKRYTHCYIMLNLYPYNAGHVMIVPFAHCDKLAHLSPQARAEIAQAASECETALLQTLKADGINMGLNIGGKAAGGTIPEHLHMHVLPRFHGDTNFLPLLSDTKQISLNLVEVYKRLKDSF